MRASRLPSMRRQQVLFQVLYLIPALALLALAYTTIYGMLVLAIKSPAQRYVDFWGLPNPPQWGVFRAAFIDLMDPLFNTVVIIGAACLLMLAACIPAGYVFARIPFLGRELLYLTVLAMLMVPGVLTLTPTYTMTRDLGLVDSWWGVILPWAAAGQAWGVMLVRNHIAGLPGELFDAARIDGAGELKALWRIGMPLSRPIIATLLVLKTVDFYNDFIWPLLVIRTVENQVIMVVIRTYHNNVPGLLVSTLPLLVLFLFANRLYMEGLVLGAVKR